MEIGTILTLLLLRGFWLESGLRAKSEKRADYIAVGGCCILLENGYIKIYRSLLSWEWYSDINTARLFLHLLLTANYEDKKWKGKTILRGQRLTSVSKLVEETGLSTKNIRTSLEKLKRTGEVAIEAASTYSLVTIVNYGNYQESYDYSGNQNGESSANERQTKGKLSANEGQQRNKANKAKKCNNDNKSKEGESASPRSASRGKSSRFVPPSVDEVAAYCAKRNNGIDAEQFVAFYASKHWMVGKNKMGDWKQSVITWEKRRKEEGKGADDRRDIPAYDPAKMSGWHNALDDEDEITQSPANEGR